MYYLPLPKLTEAQLLVMREELRERGFSVAGIETIHARKGQDWLSINPAGLAHSPVDLLDTVVPPLVRVLDQPRSFSSSNPYYAMKKRSAGFELQFFPRLEALGRWTSLRRQGGCGLTPDEALVLGRALSASPEEMVECITDYPTEDCSPTQFGRFALFRSRIRASEFVANLRTFFGSARKSAYLPRNSIIRIGNPPVPPDSSLLNELGEWCFIDFLPKSSNS